MIRINLLPSARKKKKAKMAVPQVPIIPMAAVFAVTAIAAGYFWFTLENKVTSLKREKSTKEKTLSELKEKIKEVENFEKDNKLYEERTNIIEKLRRAQSGPVRLLDEISSWIPERIWLLSMDESGGTVTIEGNAFSNSDIVTFVNNLKGSKYLADVGLLESKQTTQEKIPVFHFKLTCKVKV
jgi:type IV pilus assembly protein PilN